MPKPSARVAALLVLTLLISGLVAGGYLDVQRQRSSRMVIQALSLPVNNPAIRDAALKYALEHGGDPNALEECGATPPGVRGWIKTYLLPDYPCFSAMTLAIQLHDLAAIRLLIAHGANVNARDGTGMTYIMWFVKEWYAPASQSGCRGSCPEPPGVI